MVQVVLVVAALCRAVTVLVFGHGRLGLVQEHPRLPVVTPAPLAQWGRSLGQWRPCALQLQIFPSALAKQRTAPEAAARPSLRHGGDGDGGAPLELLGFEELGLAGCLLHPERPTGGHLHQ